MKKKSILIIISVIILILVDQLTKFFVVKYFNVNDYLIIIKDFLKFFYIRNTGAAFGLLSGLTIVLSIVSIILIFYIVKEIKNENNNLVLCSYTLILSGAIGNLIDRIFRKYVVDFISFTLFNREMAIFNVADIFITFGVIIFIYNMIKEEINERRNS